MRNPAANYHVEAETVVEHYCPYCLHFASVVVRDKTTEACRECNRPYEVYPNGEVEISMLYAVRGRLEREYDGPCTCFGRPSITTAEDDIKSGRF
jgi:hypothetical protein